jgi:hypothetical protein
MRVTVKGPVSEGVTSKDIVLHVIGCIGTAGGTGHVIEFAGEAIQARASSNFPNTMILRITLTLTQHNTTQLYTTLRSPLSGQALSMEARMR